MCCQLNIIAHGLLVRIVQQHTVAITHLLLRVLLLCNESSLCVAVLALCLCDSLQSALQRFQDNVTPISTCLMLVLVLLLLLMMMIICQVVFVSVCVVAVFAEYWFYDCVQRVRSSFAKTKV